MSTPEPPQDACLGRWNAWAEAGESKAVRGYRMARAPSEIQDDIRDHLQTVYALRAAGGARLVMDRGESVENAAKIKGVEIADVEQWIKRINLERYHAKNS